MRDRIKKNKIRFKTCIIIAFCYGYASSLFAQSQQIDTTRIYSLTEVVVADSYKTREVRSSVPTQSFSKEELKKLQALQVSDAVKHFAGVTVKDYGGIGGLKTVSIRSLGAEHTAIGYDGITLSDCQTGQIDIGRYSLENIDRLSLSNGQSDNIFQPARFFASAGLLNIQTLTPQFKDRRTTHVYGNFKTGSWGLVNPSLLVEQKLNNKWALSVNGEWMSANGQYPYTLYYGDEGDLTSREKRQNTEVQTLRTEAGLYANFSETEQWRTKVYYYQSSRGLPNATTLYNNYSSQHLWDKNVFAQSQYKKEFSNQLAFQASGKWNWSYQRYLDPDYKNVQQKLDNRYYQQEYYLSASLLYRMLSNLSFSVSTDGSINTLNANLSGFSYPSRYSWLTVVAAKYVNNWITLTASGLATIIHEKTEQGDSGSNHRKLTPYISASFKPIESEDFRIRFFYKDVFRLPNFNDLYYGQIGNTNLRPENARQYNLGLTYNKSLCDVIPYLSVTTDLYYNRITDKIIAIPNKNLFIWSMTNLGRVEIKGIDVTGSISIRPWEKLRMNFSGNYTYQRALDMTDPKSKTYQHQIAYTPRTSASGQAGIETPWINLSYSLLYSGKRYTFGQNISKNRLPGYTDHSLSASRDLRIRHMHTTLSAEVLNLLDKNYEVVKNFPMPGRSVRATIKIIY